MTLWQHIKWCFNAVEPLPEANCKGTELWFVAVVVVACATVIGGAP